MNKYFTDKVKRLSKAGTTSPRILITQSSMRFCGGRREGEAPIESKYVSRPEIQTASRPGNYHIGPVD